MPRKVTPGFHRKQERGPERRGDDVTVYFSYATLQALADLARARGISRSALVRGIVEASPDVAAQTEANAAMMGQPDQGEDGGAYGSLFADQPDLWESDQEHPASGSDQPDQGPTYGTPTPTPHGMGSGAGHMDQGPTRESDQTDIAQASDQTGSGPTALPRHPDRGSPDQGKQERPKAPTRGRGKATRPTIEGKATA